MSLRYVNCELPSGLEKSIVEFEDFFDLLIKPYFDQPFYVGFNVGGYELALLPDADPALGALVYWGVADVPQAVARAIASGSTEHTPVADVGDGIVTATVTTPFGSILGFIFNPNFSLA